MDAFSDGTDEKYERNFLQLHRLLLKSTRVLKAKFDSFVPHTQLKSWLPNDRDLKKAKLTDYQIRLMKRNPDSKEFDISLLISLLRNFCYTRETNNPLWKEENNRNILPSMTCDIASLVRIRNLRNKVCLL